MRFQNTNTTNPNNKQINKHTKTNQERTYTKQQIEMSSPQKHTKNNFTILKIPHIFSMVHIVGRADWLEFAYKHKHSQYAYNCIIIFTICIQIQSDGQQEWDK